MFRVVEPAYTQGILSINSGVHLYLFHQIFRVMGISCNIIKPKEIAKLHPLVNIHDLVGALHLPADAVVSPPDVNHALAVAAAGHGKRLKLTTSD